MTDIVTGEIVNVSPEGELTIKATILLDDYIKKGYQHVTLYLQDSRQISDKQRRFCYSLIAEIADWMGEHAKSADRELTKTYMKLKYITEDMEPLAAHLFSMVNAPVDVINGFLKFLIEFILENGIPTRFSLLEYIDENSIADYVYMCLIHRKCCICGKPAGLQEGAREGMKVLPLCREHRSENHDIGDIEFFKKYHLDGDIVMDKTLCKIWKVKANKENNK